MSEEYDVIIIGGGVTGLGILAALHNAKINAALLEQADIASKTSNNSLRIIHGGFRYLQTLNLFRVFESIACQNKLQKRFPEQLVKLPCLLPLKKFAVASKYPVFVATILYNFIYKQITGNENNATVLDPKKAEQKELFLLETLNTSVLLWHDFMLKDPKQFIASYLSEQKVPEVLIRRNEKVTQVSKQANSYFIKSNLAEYKTKMVIDATNLYDNDINYQGINNQPKTDYALAFNLIFKQKVLRKHAIALKSTERNLFLTPRASTCALGTFYYPVSTKKAKVEQQMIEDALLEFNSISKNFNPTLADIESVESGVIPVKKFSGVNPIFWGSSRIFFKQGYLAVLATKYTTFEDTSEKILKIVKKYLT